MRASRDVAALGWRASVVLRAGQPAAERERSAPDSTAQPPRCCCASSVAAPAMTAEVQRHDVISAIFGAHLLDLEELLRVEVVVRRRSFVGRH